MLRGLSAGSACFSFTSTLLYWWTQGEFNPLSPLARRRDHAPIFWAHLIKKLPGYAIAYGICYTPRSSMPQNTFHQVQMGVLMHPYRDQQMCWGMERKEGLEPIFDSLEDCRPTHGPFPQMGATTLLSPPTEHPSAMPLSCGALNYYFERILKERVDDAVSASSKPCFVMRRRQGGG